MTVTAATAADPRFTVPLYSVAEAACYLRIPRQTFGTWVDGRPSEPGVAGLVTTVRSRGPQGEHRIPFIGIAEAFVLNAFRRGGVPLQRIRPSLEALQARLGPHALASDRLYTDGAEILWNEAHRSRSDQGETLRLLVPRSNQYAFNEVVAGYLKRIVFSDHYARLISLNGYGDADVVLDPQRGYGRPIFNQAGAMVANVLGAIKGGDSIEEAAADYGLPPDQLRTAWSLSALGR